MIPTLTTRRLTLDAFTLADSERVELLAGNEEVSRATLNIPYPYPKGAAKLWIAGHLSTFLKGEGITFAIRLKRELIGCLGLAITQRDDRADMGYWVGEPYWNQGYTTEAAAACLNYAFKTLGLNRISAHHYSNNPASGRVMEKIGMQHEGVLRAHIKKAGAFYDVVQYAVLNEAPPGVTIP